MWQDTSGNVCANVSTWSEKGGYLETGLLPNLFPPNGSTKVPAGELQQNTLPYAPLKVIDTPWGKAVVAMISVAGLGIFSAAVLRFCI